MPTKDSTIAMVGAGGDGVVTMGRPHRAVGRPGRAQRRSRRRRTARRSAARGLLHGAARPRRDLRAGGPADVLVVFRWADFAPFKGESPPQRTPSILFEAGRPTPARSSISRPGRPTPGPGPVRVSLCGLRGTPEQERRGPRGPHRALRPPGGEPAPAVATLRAEEGGGRASEREGVRGRSRFARSLTATASAKRARYARGAPAPHLGQRGCPRWARCTPGCRFFAGYPITPSTEILHFLAEWLPRWAAPSSRPRTSSPRSAPSSARPSRA